MFVAHNFGGENICPSQSRTNSFRKLRRRDDCKTQKDEEEPPRETRVIEPQVGEQAAGGRRATLRGGARSRRQTDGAAVPSSSRLKSVACLLATSFSFAFCRNLQVCELVSLDAFSCCSFEQQPLGCCETRRAPIELERNEDEEDFVWLTYFRVNFFASAQTTTTTTRGATSSQPVAAADDFN